MRLTTRGRAVAGVLGLVLLSSLLTVVLLATRGGGGAATDGSAGAASGAATGGASAAATSADPPAASGSPSASASGSTGPSPSAAPAHSLTDPASIWVVVDKRRPLDPMTYAPTDLASVGGGQFMRQPAASALLAMFAAARQQGVVLGADSGYRSYSYQVEVHDEAVSQLGAAQADAGSALPGYSEHQTGWAVDVGGDGCNIAVCFGSTPAGRWVAANAYRFGFIVRYPAGLQAITGYEYEPWHIRYVGPQLAGEMHARGVLTLEQWFGLPAAP